MFVGEGLCSSRFFKDRKRPGGFPSLFVINNIIILYRKYGRRRRQDPVLYMRVHLGDRQDRHSIPEHPDGRF